MKERNCLHCEQQFLAKRIDKKYCSRKCKEKASGERTGRLEKSRTKFKNPYKMFKKTFCEKCGFIPEHTCQLDVDHIDGNHSNNLEENLQTLCANCHRLKTYLNRDWE